MEQRWSQVVEMQEENAEGRLQELTLKWFTDTQASLVLHDGTVPPWFQGCITRKEAEDMLKNKPLGGFLIRLSDKAIGYILSYRGQDRCRHFVINQNKAGQLVVSGDTETHGSLGDLIEFYKTCPIQPFGETLTTSCFQPPSSELYDVVQFEKPAVSVKAMKNMWSQRSDHDCTPDRTPDRALNRTPDRIHDRVRAPDHTPSRNSTPDRTHDNDNATDHALNHSPVHNPNHAPDRTPDRPPALPPKTANRRFTPTTSYNRITPTKAVPTQTRGGAPLRISMSSSLNGKSTLYAQLDHDRGKAKTPPLTGQGSLKITPAFHPKSRGDSGPGSLPWIQPKALEVTPTAGGTTAPSTVYSELNLETSRSRSLPLLDDRQGEQHPYRHAAPSFTPLKLSPNPCKRATCQTYSLLEHVRQPVALGLPSSSSLDKLSINPLYQTAEPLPTHFLTDNTYELIPDQGFRNRPETNNSPSNTYELIPDQCLRDGSHSNTYETLKDLQPKHSESSWGIKADTWRRFFPENKKK